ncbi:hypothetical protein PHJA_002875600 [Phtheirospermum japonicum]|uniref:Uncharacterized protein n=1 Tax=Phtheirospermum japonicum TaxID=374723 RepID=A0A830DG39_9LAMI|nr:hypothetical protein PHJA_002875600 [Phtheirospermum japonicum]
MVMEVVHEDIGEDNMQCINHPYKNSTPGGICAFCLQEKLGKLVSSSYPSSVFPSSSSSSSTHSSRSAFNGSAAAAPQPQNLASSSQTNGCYTRKSKLMPFVLTHKKKKNIKDGAMRSKSTATPRRRGNYNDNNNIHFLDENYSYSPSRRGFWSFLYSSKHTTPKKNDGHSKDLSFNTHTHTVGSSSSVVRKREDDDFVAVDENCISPKVSRSRSVGCGSRSFSGDFFERISTGFGDCTLRRVESQREGGGNKPKVQPVQRNIENGIKNAQEYCIKERVRCGGIFSGFMIASVEDSNNNVSHIKSKSWVWAFASPIRAFGKPSHGKRDANNKNNNNSSSKNASPNLDAIPSLLAVSG